MRIASTKRGAFVSLALAELHAAGSSDELGCRRDPRERYCLLLPDWRELVTAGTSIGSPGAAVTVIEFADFECPYCRRADSLFRIVTAKFPRQIDVVYVHFPITGHRFAGPAARAAECAATQGRFAAMHDLLFDKQDSLGLKTWASYADESGVPDMPRFNECVESTDDIPHLAAGIAAGNKIHVTGTPTIIVDGWRYFRPPDQAELTAAVQRAFRQHKPARTATRELGGRATR
jgi:protein-disulfide isomerase